MINIKTGIYTLQVQGSPITECTGNHRFYVRYKTKHWNSDIHKYEYHWTVPEWKSVENFNGKEYIKCPNSQYSEIIDKELWQPVKKVQFDKNRTETVYNLEVENAHSYTANNLAAHNCQDFSVAGKRAGFDGDRSVLVREVFRIIREQNECDKPEWLIYENVKGMLSSNRGFDFLAILLEMDELGYDCEWQTFNTRYFGIPQNRERVYTVGHLRTRGTRKLFPFQSSSGTNSSTKINIIAATISITTLITIIIRANPSLASCHCFNQNQRSTPNTNNASAIIRKIAIPCFRFCLKLLKKYFATYPSPTVIPFIAV